MGNRTITLSLVGLTGVAVLLSAGTAHRRDRAEPVVDAVDTTDYRVQGSAFFIF